MGRGSATASLLHLQPKENQLTIPIVNPKSPTPFQDLSYLLIRKGPDISFKGTVETRNALATCGFCCDATRKQVPSYIVEVCGQLDPTLATRTKKEKMSWLLPGGNQDPANPAAAPDIDLVRHNTLAEGRLAPLLNFLKSYEGSKTSLEEFAVLVVFASCWELLLAPLMVTCVSEEPTLSKLDESSEWAASSSVELRSSSVVSSSPELSNAALGDCGRLCAASCRSLAGV
ncbi:uncharacterized protein BDZ99DRAFT_503549 [Mytilinidion resinicola]|uniref:Uncharacterized protein n=1 Tax=Mytilinidion resinicola TaxID=574789 RepID=A0A6A6Y314_9PEZI|nr:uncharacterized protein BDZ99DRAFT_503549 [Mytilinidion resinicola]KAF2803182.1 hypothetical protein BDZ99DRAFT_503549 [Mytilinidion resinicola]